MYMRAKLCLLMPCLMLARGCSTAPPALANELHHEIAIKAILGESEHTDPAMRAMAWALKNRYAKRGDLKGVYGLQAKIFGQIGPNLRQKALKAWFLTAYSEDVTLGATNWLSDWDLTHCRPSLIAWRKKMQETAYIGHTHFYREVK